MSEKTATGWIVPALVGIAVGAIVAGGPLLYVNAQKTSRFNEISARLASTTADLTTAAQELENLQAASQQLQAERAALQTQITDQEKVAQELARPDLPIQLSVRQGFIDAGYVLTMRNVSARELVVKAKFSGAGGAEQVRRIVLPANAAREVGESEGWAFSSQDSIALTNPDYRDLVYTIPAR